MSYASLEVLNAAERAEIYSASMSDDFAYSNGTIARINSFFMAERTKLSASLAKPAKGNLPLDLSGLKLPTTVRAEIDRSPSFFSAWPAQILRLDGNAKTVKGNKKGFATAILYLTPANGSGFNVCPLAVAAGCVAPCLYTAGRGAMSNVHLGRLRKTLAYMSDRARFMAQIHAELRTLRRTCARKDLDLLVRLNGTSDIRFEAIPVAGHGNIMLANPDIQFYDYTKLPNRKGIPANYDLTFSYSGMAGFAPHVAVARNAGMRIAVVFRNRATVARMLANGETFQGLPVVDGDDSDIRHLDPMGAVVALYAKGKAKKDTSGFVVG